MTPNKARDSSEILPTLQFKSKRIPHCTSLQVSSLDCAALRLVFILRVHRGRKMVHRHELLGALRHVHLLRVQGYEVRSST